LACIFQHLSIQKSQPNLASHLTAGFLARAVLIEEQHFPASPLVLLFTVAELIRRRNRRDQNPSLSGIRHEFVSKVDSLQLFCDENLRASNDLSLRFHRK
jgi:hypothetical protein